MATVRPEKMQFILEGLKHLDFGFTTNPKKSKRLKLNSVNESLAEDWQSVNDEFLMTTLDLVDSEIGKLTASQFSKSELTSLNLDNLKLPITSVSEQNIADPKTLQRLADIRLRLLDINTVKTTKNNAKDQFMKIHRRKSRKSGAK
jgi:hypothetical protein